MSEERRELKKVSGRFVRAAAGCACAVLAASAFAAAGDYPNRPVRIIVPYAAGGPYDNIARVVGKALYGIWGQTVISDPRGGAGGSLGTELAVKAPKDGYSLLVANAGPITVNPSLQKQLSYDPERDLIPISYMLASQMVLVVHPSLPVRSVKDLVAFAKARPGKLNYASAGVGNLQHLAMEYLQSITGMKLVHIPYKGAAPAFVDLLAGQEALMFANITGVYGHVEAKRLRAIGVSSSKRAAILPDVPAIAETYPRFDITAWTGLFAPAGTPPEVIAKIKAGVSQALQQKDVRDHFTKLGAEVIDGPADQLAQLIRQETALYAEVIRKADITPN